MKSNINNKTETAEQSEIAIFVQFVSETGEELGDTISIPTNITPNEMNELVNNLLNNSDSKDLAVSEKQQYGFFVGEEEIRINIANYLKAHSDSIDLEKTLAVTYRPLALFSVSAVARCVADMPGHTDAVLSLSFSPDASTLASGSGDQTIRIWDSHTATCKQVLTGHTSWVLCVRYSPNGKMLASAAHNGEIRIWDMGLRLGTAGRVLKAHTKWVTAIAWEPFHLNPECRRLVSGGKDGYVRVWDAINGTCVKTLFKSEKAITDVAWSGRGYLIATSEDCSIYIFKADGNWPHCAKITSHSHWVNSIALSSSHVLALGNCSFINEVRAKKPNYTKLVQEYKGLIEKSKSYYTCNTSPIDKTTGLRVKTEQEVRTELDVRLASLKFEEVMVTQGKYLGKLPDEATANENKEEIKGRKEILATCSDDQTICLFELGASKPYARLTGHAKPINHICFSPDGRYLASASFDKTVRIWDVRLGKLYHIYRNHVAEVYRLAFSADSRMVMSCSKDSTCKVFSIQKKTMLRDLPGHADAVYAVDWAVDGSVAASAGKDRVVKVWKN